MAATIATFAPCQPKALAKMALGFWWCAAGFPTRTSPMIVTTQFPDLPPTPETASNAGFRKRFFSRYGRENSVFVACARQAAYGPLPTALSFKTVLRGSAALTIGRRRLLLEPGLFLIVNAGDAYSVAIDSPDPVKCLSVHFRPELAAEVAQAQGMDWRAALAQEGDAASVPDFRETLTRLEPALQQHVLHLAASVQPGRQADLVALEQALIALLQAMLQGQARRQREFLSHVPALRPSTRKELLRRIDWAADFMLSHYVDAITLDDIAQAAHLSKFHLLRAFQQVHQRTPHQFLRARRVEVAQRLLGDRRWDLETVATAAGFGSRWSMQRALRLHLGATGSSLRETARV